MTVGGPPFSDNIPDGGIVAPRGAYVWIPTRLTFVGGQSTVPVDVGTFAQLGIVTLKDPDGNSIASWRTPDRDTSDPDDVYDEDHSTYQGDVRTVGDGVLTATSTTITSATATFIARDVGHAIAGGSIPAGAYIVQVVNSTTAVISSAPTVSAVGVGITIGVASIGLYYDGSGHIAQKVLTPISAEVTTGSSDRRFSVTWALIKKNGAVVASKTEYFNVSEAGVLLFGNTVITVQEVTDGLTTTLGTEQIERLIVRSSRFVNGMFQDYCGVNLDTLETDSLPPSAREAIILYTQGLIVDNDASAGGIPTMRKEGKKELRYSVSSQKLATSFYSRADAAVRRWCASNKNRPRLRVSRQVPEVGVWRPLASVPAPPIDPFQLV